MNDTERAEARTRWLDAALRARGETPVGPPSALVAEASFRRFWRVGTDAGARILVDAPAERENNAGFVAVAHWLERQGLPAARVLAIDADAGFLLVTDLGDDTLAVVTARAPDRAQACYRAAVDLLVEFQAAACADDPGFPAYDGARLALENSLFETWFLRAYLGLPKAPAVLDGALEVLTETHLQAPRVAVHLDWHSRNLMVGADGTIAMLDFQDARTGPQGYDLVSLLRDCYCAEDPTRTAELLRHFRNAGADRGLPGCGDASAEAFERTFDLVGMQRHLKAMGIFARLAVRDGRRHALGDLLRTLDHVLRTAGRHPEFGALATWLGDEIRPRLAAAP